MQPQTSFISPVVSTQENKKTIFFSYAFVSSSLSAFSVQQRANPPLLRLCFSQAIYALPYVQDTSCIFHYETVVTGTCIAMHQQRSFFS